MRRYPAYDPQEYVSWRALPEVMASFRALITDAPPERRALIDGLDADALLALYRGLLRARLHDISLQRWVKQGVITKAWLGTGEEASTVGCIHALEPDDVAAPMIRNASACIEKGVPLLGMFSAYLATTQNPTRGRDLHTGGLEHGILIPISHVAAVVPVAAGIAMAFKMDREDRVVICWTGDGATRCGEFHEGLNFAASQRSPAIFVVQDNSVALGTRTETHMRGNFAAMGAAYGIPCLKADGNHVLDVWAATKEARRIAASGEGPVLLVLKTFRMGGHATHDVAEGRRLFPADLFAHWGARDPIGCFEEWLAWDAPDLSKEASVAGSPEARAELHRRLMHSIEVEVTQEMDEAAEAALAGRKTHQPDPSTLREGLFSAPL